MPLTAVGCERRPKGARLTLLSRRFVETYWETRQSGFEPAIETSKSRRNGEGDALTTVGREMATTEIPRPLKLLVQKVMRGFYPIDHFIVVDILVRKQLMKEDDLADLLKFDKKQLRQVIASLKNDKLLKVKLRMETGSDMKATRQNYYFINYKAFVNVVKYKLDHMRKKIEMEERDSASRAMFICSACNKSFTDLEVDQLVDLTTGDFRFVIIKLHYN